VIRPTSPPGTTAARRGAAVRFVEEIVAAGERGTWFEWDGPVNRNVVTRRAEQVAAAAGVELVVELCPVTPGAAETHYRLKGRLKIMETRE